MRLNGDEEIKKLTEKYMADLVDLYDSVIEPDPNKPKYPLTILIALSSDDTALVANGCKVCMITQILTILIASGQQHEHCLIADIANDNLNKVH